MEMLSDPSRVGAERLAANMESYLGGGELSAGQRSAGGGGGRLGAVR